MAYRSPFSGLYGLTQIDGETIQVLYTKLFSSGKLGSSGDVGRLNDAVILAHNDFSMSDH